MRPKERLIDPLLREAGFTLHVPYRHDPLTGFTHNPDPKVYERNGSRYATVWMGPTQIAYSSAYLYTRPDRNGVYISRDQDPDDPVWALEYVQTSPDERHKGHATAAIRAFLRCFDETGVSLRLEVAPARRKRGVPSMPASKLRKWYASLGFVPVGTSSVLMERRAPQPATV